MIALKAGNVDSLKVTDEPAELLSEILASDAETCRRMYVHVFSERLPPLVTLKPSEELDAVSLRSLPTVSSKTTEFAFLSWRMFPELDAETLSHKDTSSWE